VEHVRSNNFAGKETKCIPLLVALLAVVASFVRYRARGLLNQGSFAHLTLAHENHQDSTYYLNSDIEVMK
jgi:hypothetical protein